MIAGHDPAAPPFVYHAAAKLPLRAAERLLRESAQEAQDRATEAIANALRDLRARGHRVIASGIIAGNKPFSSPLERTLASHSLIHSAEGELFRQAIVSGCEACGIPITSVAAKELYARGAKELRLSEALLRARLTEAGRGTKPWAQDQKESLLIALLALAQRNG